MSDLSSSILAVQLLPEETDVEIALNNALKEVFSEKWSISEVEYFSIDDFNKLKQSQSKEYFFLEQRDRLYDHIRFKMDYIDGALVGRIRASSLDPDAHALSYIESHKIEEVNLEYYDFILTAPDGKFVTTVSFVNSELTKLDYLFLCQQLNLLLNDSLNGGSKGAFQNPRDNMETLKNATAYFLEDYLSEKVRRSFSDYYPNRYEFIDYRKYQDVILAQEEGTVYIKFLFSMQHNQFMWGLVDAVTGRVLSLNELGSKYTGVIKVDRIIKPNALKIAADYDIQKFINRYNK